MLISVAADQANYLLQRLREEETLAANVIGRISDGPAGTIRSVPETLIDAAALERHPARSTRVCHSARQAGIAHRRGTEYVVTAVRLTTRENRDALVGRHPMTGEELEFLLEDVDAFEVVGE